MLTSSTSTHSETTHTVGEEAHSADSVPGTSRPRAVLLAAEVATRRGDAVVLTPGRWGVGSADGNQIVIDHETVASRHAMIIVTEHRVLVTSWASGTYVNGERCRESLLCPGDVLTIGTVDLRLRAADSSELISHLPDVNSAANRSQVMRPVTAEETLRRLDDLDTALGLLDEELAGSNESADQLDELIDQIETDIARRADDPSRQVEADSPIEGQLCAPSSDDVSAAAMAEPWAGEGVAEDVSRPLNASYPLSLDELMSDVVSSEAEAEVDFAAVETRFSNAADSDFADDEHPSEAEEFSQLVGSTSVLAQNLTLNALRSRAEAVRQLDEMILAASQNDISIDRVTGSGSSTTTPPDRPSSAASDDWPEAAESDAMASEFQAELSSYNEAGDAADDDDFFADEPSAEHPAANDDWLAENPSQSESQPEVEGSDTVEFSAMDTVNEAGSLLASLFGEDASDRQTASVEAAEEPDWISEPEATVSESVEPIDSELVEPFELPTDQDGALPDAEFDSASEADTEFDLTSMSERPSDANVGAEALIEADAVGETDEDATVVRSRLAEMFGLPGLKSVSPLQAEAEDSRDATANESPFDSPDADLPWDSVEQDHDTSRAASVTASTNLTSGLDGMRGGRLTPVEQNGDQVDAAGDSTADQAEPQAQSDKQSVASDLDRTKGSTEGDGDDSVAAYMQALLARNRVRQGQPEQPDAYVVMPTAASSETIDESEEAEQDAVDVEACEQLSEVDSREVSDGDQSPSWLSQEPKHQLDKDRMRADTQALREVANASARSAVTRASRRQLKVQVVVKTTASVVMLGCGVAASLLGVSTMFAALAMGVGAYFAFDLGLTIVRNWKRITS